MSVAFVTTWDTCILRIFLSPNLRESKKLKIIVHYQNENKDTIRKGANWMQYELMCSWYNHSIDPDMESNTTTDRTKVSGTKCRPDTF
jgi:hypothetical protein